MPSRATSSCGRGRVPVIRSRDRDGGSCQPSAGCAGSWSRPRDAWRWAVACSLASTTAVAAARRWRVSIQVSLWMPRARPAALLCCGMASPPYDTARARHRDARRIATDDVADLNAESGGDTDLPSSDGSGVCVSVLASAAVVQTSCRRRPDFRPSRLVLARFQGTASVSRRSHRAV